MDTCRQTESLIQLKGQTFFFHLNGPFKRIVYFSLNAKFLRTSILKNICERLLLKIYPVLLLSFLEDISEIAFCRRSTK